MIAASDKLHVLLCIILFASLNACNVLEKTFWHGLESGNYTLKSSEKERVYIDLVDGRMDVYHRAKEGVGSLKMSLNLEEMDTTFSQPFTLSRNSVDVDATTILLKFRPGVHNQPAQMSTDFNGAIYSGWRHDKYKVKTSTDPLNRSHLQLVNRGFDVGVFAGPGTTLVSPFTTLGKYSNEYMAAIVQYGVAGFVESNVAIFGFSTGFDYMLSPDRQIWIYNRKPWIGFIVGFALN